MGDFPDQNGLRVSLVPLGVVASATKPFVAVMTGRIILQHYCVLSEQ